MAQSLRAAIATGSSLVRTNRLAGVSPSFNPRTGTEPVPEMCQHNGSERYCDASYDQFGLK